MGQSSGPWSGGALLLSSNMFFFVMFILLQVFQYQFLYGLQEITSNCFTHYHCQMLTTLFDPIDDRRRNRRAVYHFFTNYNNTTSCSLALAREILIYLIILYFGNLLKLNLTICVFYLLLLLIYTQKQISNIKVLCPSLGLTVIF